jgi:Ca2+-binding EF-hand superfamily protein
MSNYLLLIVYLVLAGVVAPGSVTAQVEPEKGDDWLVLQISGPLMRHNATVDTALQQLRSIFIKSDFDGGGVSARDYVLAEQVDQANLRSDMLKRWGKWDLDNDGEVTRAELELYFSQQSRQAFAGPGGVSLLPTKEQSTEILAKLTGDELVWDFDHDGTITLAEVRQAAGETWAKRHSTYNDSKRRLVPLSLDTDNDNTVNFAEFDAAVRLLLDTIDRNGDGKISADEGTSLRERVSAINKAQNERVRQEKISEKVKACGLTSPGANTKVIMIGTYEGEGLSTVSLGDDDEVVGVPTFQSRVGPSRCMSY